MLSGLKAAPLSNGVGDAIPVAMRNRIVNGNFIINQRGVSGSVVLAAGAYGHDRWKAGAGGCTYTFAASGSDTVLTITAGSLIQVVEGANVEGGAYAMSWFGTSTGKIGAGATGASGVTGTATASANLNVEFGLGTLSRVQLEPGTVGTLFERRPIGLELGLCKRYFNSLQVSFRTYTVLAGQVAEIPLMWPEMRASPTAVGTPGTGYANSNTVSDTLTVSTASAGRWVFTFNVTATDSYLFNKVWSLSAEL